MPQVLIRSAHMPEYKQQKIDSTIAKVWVSS